VSGANAAESAAYNESKSPNESQPGLQNELGAVPGRNGMCIAAQVLSASRPLHGLTSCHSSVA
jgi:hypothetical protein